MKESWKVDIWKEGKYFDLWHVNHFLAGLLLANLTLFLKIELWIGFTFSLTLMLAWEVFEIVKKIEETKFNRCFDVIFSVASFFLVIYLNQNYLLTTGLNILFYFSLILWLILESWGYWAYKIRSRKE